MRSFKFGFVAAMLIALQPAAAHANGPSVGGTPFNTQMGVGPCAFAPETEVTKDIATAVITSVISKGVNLFASALTKAAEANVKRFRASKNLDANALSHGICIQVVRGKLATSAPETPYQDAAWPEGAGQKLARNGVWLTGAPDFIFEGRVIVSKDGEAIAIRPTFAVLNEFAADGFLNKKDKRGILMLFCFHAPAESPNLEDQASAALPLGDLRKGQAIVFGPPIEGSGPFDSPWFTLAKNNAEKPLTISAMMVETRPGNGFLKFVSDVVNDQAVQTAVEDRLKKAALPAPESGS